MCVCVCVCARMCVFLFSCAAVLLSSQQARKQGSVSFRIAMACIKVVKQHLQFDTGEKWYIDGWESGSIINENGDDLKVRVGSDGEPYVEMNPYSIAWIRAIGNDEFKVKFPWRFSNSCAFLELIHLRNAASFDAKPKDPPKPKRKLFVDTTQPANKHLKIEYPKMSIPLTKELRERVDIVSVSLPAYGGQDALLETHVLKAVWKRDRVFVHLHEDTISHLIGWMRDSGSQGDGIRGVYDKSKANPSSEPVEGDDL